MTTTLVIGFGNILRSDDGAGPHAAERIAAQYRAVDWLSVAELTPELAETITHYDRVVFVDASIGTTFLQWKPLPMRVEQSLPPSHHLTPQAVVELAILLYDQCPSQLELVEIPAFDFEFGRDFSPLTREMLEHFIRLFGTTSGVPDSFHAGC